MKTLTLFVCLTFSACGNGISSHHSEFSRILPDTAITWSGQRTLDAFRRTEKFRYKNGMTSIFHGVEGEEIRIWKLSGSYAPQTVTILSKKDPVGFSYRRVSFYDSKDDSVSSDVSKAIDAALYESLELDGLWRLKSHSDMKKGDDFGCQDGEDVFIEMANTEQYRFIWFRCPAINKDKDSAFYKVNELQRLIAEMEGNGL